MAPSASYGPFLDEHGLHVWFDLFEPIRLISVLLRRRLHPGAAGADLGDDHRPAVVSHRSRQRLDRVEPHRTGGGAAGLLHGPEDHGRVARSLAGRDGVRRQTSSSRRRQPHPSTSIWIRPPRRTHRQTAGIDAAEAVVQLAEDASICSSSCRPAPSAGGRASCTVFGCQVDFEQTGQPPIWLPLISQVLIPYSATTHTNDPGSLRDRLVEVGALHGRRARADRSSADGVAPAGREDRPG